MTTTENEIFYSLIDTLDVNVVKLFHKQNKRLIDINQVHIDGETALHKAIGTGCIKMVRLVMRLGPNLEVRSSRGWTALHKAVHENNIEAVNVLLAHNANINARTTDHGKTPLHMAVFNDSMVLTRNLLVRNADPNLLISSGTFQFYSALHIAVINNHMDMVQLLLRHGVNTELRCHQGYTALWLAVLNSHVPIVKLLCHYHANCNAKPTGGPYRNCSPLFAAVELNKLEMVRILIKNSAYINARDDVGRTPLHHAVDIVRHDMVKLLLENRAALNASTFGGDHKGSTPLFFAVNNKNFGMVKWLLERKAKVNVKRADGSTPLHCAIQSACFVIAKLLIKYQADVNVVRGWHNETPLHDAVQLGDNLMVNLLLHKKARVNVKNGKGKTPLYLAASLGYWRIVSRLLKYGADPNVCDSKLNSPLHAAIRTKQFKTVILLVQAGANVNAFNNRFQTPLYFALRSDNENIINILLNRGAQFTTKCIPKNSKGYFEYITDERTLQYLIDQGVDVNHQSSEGETALHRLIQVSIPEVVAYIKSFMDMDTSKQGILIFNDGAVSDTLFYPAVHGSGLNAVDYHNFNAIIIGIHKRAVDLFNCSLLYGSTLSTAVSVATNSDSMKSLFQTLVKSGIDLERRDNSGCTPLHLATKCRRHAYMRMLLENGAKVDPEDNTGMTPLMLAMRNTDHIAITILLGNGASGTALTSVAYRFCDQQYKLPRVLLHFENVKRKFIENGSWSNDADEPSLEAIVEACKAEVASMTSCFVGDSRLSFIDLVTKPVYKLVPFIRNAEIKQVLDSRHFRHLYPIFADDIKVKIGQMMLKNKELIDCQVTLDKLFDHSIPYLVVNHIIQFLNDADFKSLTQIYKKIY